MTATGERPGSSVGTAGGVLERAPGVELLGAVQGSGYRDGAALVRRADGQMVHLGPLLFGLLECIDGRRDADGLAAAMTERLGRHLDPDQVRVLAGKLAAQGLLAGSEAAAPPRANPLLALRWKVLVTDPAVTRRLTAPFAVLFRPWLMWPVLVAFAAVCWFVLIDKGVASATAEAFHSPGLLLLVFALAVLSAGAHELGHAAACRYGGATPGGMGMGLYLVWPAFYTDVTDAYRLDRRGRLRVDLAGLYFNALVAVLTMAVWLAVRRDALLLLVALQLLQMVKQLSPVIRADGYHILADATGVPDLYAHIGPTMRRLLPGGRRSPSALTGRARAIVTVWVLVVVPVLLSLMLGAVLLLPRLLSSAWTSGRAIAGGLPHDLGSGDVVGVLAALLELIALFLPVLGSVLIVQRLVRTAIGKARAWSAGRPGRRAVAVIAAVAVLAGLAWAWWPSGQYRPVRASEHGTLPSFVQMLGSPQTVVRSSSTPVLALAAVPEGGATAAHPALFLLPGSDGSDASGVVVGGPDGAGAAFPFRLPAKPGPGGTQALAVGTKDGGVVYDISYALVTVTDGAPVTNTNGAFAFAHCRGCTTVAVSFQVVLVVGRSDTIAPINAAGALNVDCPACMTTAMADQIVVTVSRQPSAELRKKLQASLAKLDALPSLGADATPDEVAAQVAAVQQQVQKALDDSGIVTGEPAATSTGATPTASASPTGTSPASATTTAAATATTPAEPTGSAATTSSPAASTASSTTSSAPASSTAPPASGP